MRYFVLYMCMFLSSLSLLAQKIEDRSQNKRPEWVGGTLQDYLIVSASANELEVAKQKCLVAIKVQMLESVAQNIEYSTETIVEQLTHNEKVESSIKFKQQGKTNVVNLPYISGISLSKAKDSYWELILDETTKERSYTFSVLYPYTESDYSLLKNEFDKLDKEMIDLVEFCEEQLRVSTNVDVIEDNLNKLELAKDYFFDKRRLSWTESILASYKLFFRNMIVETEKIGENRFKCHLVHNGRKLSSSVIPKLKSECVSEMKCTIQENVYVLTFSNEDCIEDERNYIELNFRFSLRNLKHKLYF